MRVADFVRSDESRSIEPSRQRAFATVALILLGCAMLAVALAPRLMPATYSVIEHSISESAAQGMEGAWLARSAFLLVGCAVLLMVSASGDLWGRWGRLGMTVYAVATLAAGVFAHGPWEDVPFDRVEGYLHTVAAFFAGLGFAVGVLAVSYRRGRGWRRALDGLALISVAVIPITMLIFDGQTGIQQRFLALVGFAWMILETIRVGWSGQPGARSRAGPYTRSE